MNEEGRYQFSWFGRDKMVVGGGIEMGIGTRDIVGKLMGS